MTDERLPSDLESIAASVPGIPNDYAYLRSLIQSLPAPLAPDIRSAQTGQMGATDPGLTAASQIANSLTGGPIGSESGSSIGIVSELYYANSNLLDNPLLEVVDPTGDVFATTDTPFAARWRGKYVLNSGSAPDHGTSTDRLYDRTAADDNPMNTTIMEMYLGTSSLGATDYSAYVYPEFPWGPSIDSALPFLVASCKVSLWGETIDADTTKLQVRMEIVDDTGVTFGPWLNLMDHDSEWTVFRVSVARPRPAGGWNDGTVGPYLWRLRIDYAHSTAEAVGLWDWMTWGEPALALASTQAPPPFAPQLSRWVPSVLASWVWGDSQPRLVISEGDIEWGSGAANRDVELRRTAAGTLRVAAIGTADDTLQIGDDAAFVDVDVADAVALIGQQTPGNGKLIFGSAKDTNLYRSAANELKTDDSFVLGAFLRGGGTSFPASPTADDRYYRTDLDMWFFYDGTRWLSVQLYDDVFQNFNVPSNDFLSATTTEVARWAPPWQGTYDLWIEKATCNFYVNGGTALDASNKWVGTLFRENAGTTIATFNIDSGSSAVFRVLDVTVDALLGSTQYFARTDWTKTGTPGALRVHTRIQYRIVVT